MVIGKDIASSPVASVFCWSFSLYTPVHAQVVSDDFSAPSLNTALWTVVNPLNDAVVTVTGTGTSNASLSIALPAGVSHDFWTGTSGAPRVLQNISNIDFEVEAKFISPLLLQYQMQGIIVQQDNANFLRFDFVRDSKNTRLFAASFSAGIPTVRQDLTIPLVAPYYLRVKRVGNSWTASYSADGTAWTVGATFTQALVVTAVGPYAGNHGEPVTTSPAFTGLVDYFFSTASPIVPEDGVGTVTPPSITVEPTNQTVNAGQTATFSIVAGGTEPLMYQWQRNGSSIIGATSASYTTGSTVRSDSGAIFRCIVSNSAGADTSLTALLNVISLPTGVPNAVSNGTFEAGTSGWNFYTNGAGSFSTVSPGSSGSGQALQVAITTEGTNVQLFQYGITLQPNTSYQLSFDAYGTTGHDLDVTLQRHTSPYTNYGLSGRVFNLGTNWQSFQVTFTTTNFSTAVSDARLMFWLAPYDAAGDRYYFDNIVLAKTSDLSPTLPVITLEPISQIVNEGQTASFTVTATGSAPLSYQWQKDGVSITGATASGYTTPTTVRSDSGATFRCIVSNSAGADTSSAAVLSVRQSTGPVVAFWYGTNQTFGGIGTPQRWVNVLGNASDPDGVKSLTYRLNNGSPVVLNIGANQRRLVRKGDFNIDIAFAALQAGQNSVTVTAIDSVGQSSTAAMTVTKVAGKVWPMTYDLSWALSSSLLDSAQVVDGKWAVVQGGIRPLERGYDRLIGMGDTTWTDYEVTGLFTVQGIDSTRTAYDSVNAAPGLGFILRWNGHTNTPISTPPYDQPKTGYLPLGAIGWYEWRNGFNNGLLSRWEILGNDNLAVKDQNSSVPLPYGVPHWFKMRVSTVPGVGGLYNFKAWPASQAEPSTWMLTDQESLTGPQRGGFLIVAHHVDVTIGPITVRPVDATPPVMSNIAAAPGTTTATISWTTNEPASSKVLFGQTTAYSDSIINGAGVLSHSIGLTGLVQAKLYHYKVVSQDAAGNSASSGDLTFTTNSGTSLAFQSDDFHAAALNISLWTFINPRSDAVLSLTGTGTADARLSIAVPAGVSHDVWSGNLAPRVMQQAANTDFELEVKFDAPMTTQYQVEGVIVQQDNNNFLRFDFVRDNTGPRLFAASFVSGAPTARIDTRIASGTPLYLRVRRQGNSWTPSYSYDGSAWTAASSFTQTLAVTQVGPFIGNHGVPETTTPAFTGLVDYFFNTAAPIVPEDGTVQATAPVITQEPGGQTIAVGQTATFTITATGTAPLSYLWQKNAAPISGATSASYTTPSVTASDSGALFRCIVSNSAGADTSVPALLTVTSGNTNPSGIASDQFDTTSLNGALWTFVNPLGDVSLAMTGTQLAFTLPAGVSHDVWTSGNLAPRVMQPAANADFELETKFDVVLSMAYQMQGIIVQQDASRFLRFDMYHDGAAPHIFAVAFASNVPTVYGDITLSGTSPGYFRVKRQANQWTVSHSSSGTSWTQDLTFSHTLTVTSVGPFAANHGVPVSTTPGWTALIDYFVNIVPAGAAAGGTAPVMPVPLASIIPDQFKLQGNYPNPFNPTTTIRYGLPESAVISIKVYSLLGQEVITLEEGERHAGYHEVVWNGRNANGGQVSSGLFICRLVATGSSGKTFTSVHRMILVK